MKTKPYLLTYLSTLIAGILLLVFTGQTDIFRWIVIIIGILLAVPSLWLIISSSMGRRGIAKPKAADIGQDVEQDVEQAASRGRSIFVTICGICGLVFGVILLCMSNFFAHYIVYTLGVLLIICGLAQIVYMAAISALMGINRWFYLMPWLTLIAGVVVIFLGPNGVGSIITWLAGVLLVAYSFNGFVQMAVSGRQKRLKRKSESL